MYFSVPASSCYTITVWQRLRHSMYSRTYTICVLSLFAKSDRKEESWKSTLVMPGMMTGP